MISFNWAKARCQLTVVDVSQCVAINEVHRARNWVEKSVLVKQIWRGWFIPIILAIAGVAIMLIVASVFGRWSIFVFFFLLPVLDRYFIVKRPEHDQSESDTESNSLHSDAKTLSQHFTPIAEVGTESRLKWLSEVVFSLGFALVLILGPDRIGETNTILGVIGWIAVVFAVRLIRRSGLLRRERESENIQARIDREYGANPAKAERHS